MRVDILRLIVAGLTVLAVLQPLATRAGEDDDGDHDRARDLYEHGQIKGLARILDIVRAKSPGDVVGVDLVRLEDRWIYRLQVIGGDGRRRIVDVDAGAGVIVSGGGAKE